MSNLGVPFLSKVFLMAFFVIILGVKNTAAEAIVKFYVSKQSGNDKNGGTLQSPFATLERAKEAVVNLAKSKKSYTEIKVFIRGGTYFLEKGLEFRAEQMPNAQSIIFSSYNGEKVVISGGKKLNGKWEKASPNKEIWKLKIPGLQSDESLFFKQLYSGKKLLNRASSPFFFTVGPMRQFKSIIERYNFKKASELRNSNILPFCSFEYSGTDLDGLKNLDGVDIVIDHSWESTWHNIHNIDIKQKYIHLKSPMLFPVGFFNDRTPYRVENSELYFDSPGEWYLNRKEGFLYYFAHENEDPNRNSFYIAKLETLILLSGNENAKIKNVKFEELEFSHTKARDGVSMLNRKFQQSLLVKYPWLNFKNGYSSEQAAPNCGEAIRMVGADSCQINSCKFSNLGGYAIAIGQYANQNKVVNSTFSGLGGGGLIIGFFEKDPIGKKIPFKASPSKNEVVKCTFNNLGQIHSAAVAIAIVQSHSNLIQYNKIFNLPYSGISVGWSWSDKVSFTSKNKIMYNHIHDVMNKLADGGGIYTLGFQPGTVIEGNYIHNISRSPNAIGSKNNGVFFDHGSSGIIFRNNIIEGVKQGYYRFNLSDSSKISYKQNFFGPSVQAKTLVPKITNQAGSQQSFQ